jgi:hypothetical protein
MRGIALSLAAVSGLGAALLGGRAITPARGGSARPAAVKAPATAEAAAGPVWYGGTLAPIVVVASAPHTAAARQGHECLRSGS